jgi:hypothetical protein
MQTTGLDGQELGTLCSLCGHTWHAVLSLRSICLQDADLAVHESRIAPGILAVGDQVKYSTTIDTPHDVVLPHQVYVSALRTSNAEAP